MSDDLEDDESMSKDRLIVELREALEAALEWIDAVPKDTPLPTMPGFDRDWAEGLLYTKILDSSSAPGLG